jgi:hypothetical protein
MSPARRRTEEQANPLFVIAFRPVFRKIKQYTKGTGGHSEDPSMCDYSLEHLASRPAKVGDKLVTTHFKHTLTGGFCAVGEPNIAVCLRPGTEVAFEREIESVSGFWMRRKNSARR